MTFGDINLLRSVRVKKYPAIAAAGQSYAVPLQPQLASPPTTVRFEPRTDVHMIKPSDAARVREQGSPLIRTTGTPRLKSSFGFRLLNCAGGLCLR